ncbi:MAG TPA: family 10 glycosylhydrolase [Candidatus Obscuribacterales bacterium]
MKLTKMSKGLKKLALVRSLLAIDHNFKQKSRSHQAAKPNLPSWQHCYRGAIAGLLTSSSLLSQCWYPSSVSAQTQAYCQFTREAIAEKQNLLKGSLKGNADAQKSYKVLLREHAEYLRQCRSQNWPNNQSIWLRLYPCDRLPGVLDQILDRIVNQGYNQVNLEVFGDSQVLLPASDNPTPWSSLVRAPGTENVDLLAQVIQKGRERGLRVYAWMFTMNFGYTYGLRPDKQSVLARNGKGNIALLDTLQEGPQAFIDPYNQQARSDYYRLVQAVAQRRPDGILFDYVRYPRGSGGDSVVAKLQDLWIYGDAAQQALYARSLNNKGRELIQRYISRGSISTSDIEAVDQLYPQEASPLWQGRNPPANEIQLTAAERLPKLRWDLWQLSLGHAAQGVLDFLAVATLPAQQQGIRTGAVFFPEGNQPIAQGGFDSRLQAWDRFPSSMEWHPMVYGVCGSTSCIQDQLKRVLNRASPDTRVAPVIVGLWGQSWKNRPSLEEQMQALQQVAPQIDSVSHFAFSWQNPDLDRDRQTCRVR